jgi:uracil-DNA glycosylase
MRLDRDFLSELELLSHFELRRQQRERAAGGASPVVAAKAEARAEMPVRGDAVAAEEIRPRPTPPRPVGTPAAAAPISRVAPNKPSVPAAPTVPAALATPTVTVNVSGFDWDALEGAARACQACGLCKQRKNVVVGVGNRAAPWLFIGEGPGAEEDASGEPFVGQAGKLLDAMLTAAGLQRGREVYIANVVKCRPPGNRTPQSDEAAACAPYLDRQIELIQPKIIVALGKTAITRLTGADTAMAAMRGRALSYKGIPVVATYHPAYLLRNLPEKLKAWEDLQFARTLFAQN